MARPLPPPPPLNGPAISGGTFFCFCCFPNQLKQVSCTPVSEFLTLSSVHVHCKTTRNCGKDSKFTNCIIVP